MKKTCSFSISAYLATDMMNNRLFYSTSEARYNKNTDKQPYKYNGKELDRTHGLDWYDYGARNYDAIVPQFTSIDPLCEKYYNISPYVYCGNNPISFIDPDGKSVKVDSLSQINIINSLTPEEKYIQFDENSLLNADLIQKCNSTTENFTSIKRLVLSDRNYVFIVTEKMHDGTTFYDTSTQNGKFLRGVTEYPGAELNPSPDDNIYILVGSCLSGKQQCMTTAHEAYGHAYIFDTSNYSIGAAAHHYINDTILELDEEFKMEVPVNIGFDSNKVLSNRIEIVVSSAKNNYEKRYM